MTELTFSSSQHCLPAKTRVACPFQSRTLLEPLLLCTQLAWGEISLPGFIWKHCGRRLGRTGHLQTCWAGPPSAFPLWHRDRSEAPSTHLPSLLCSCSINRDSNKSSGCPSNSTLDTWLSWKAQERTNLLFSLVHLVFTYCYSYKSTI